MKLKILEAVGPRTNFHFAQLLQRTAVGVVVVGRPEAKHETPHSRGLERLLLGNSRLTEAGPHSS